MKALVLRPRMLWAATASSSVLTLALLAAAGANGYGIPSMFFVLLFLAALAGGRRAALIAAPVVTAAYLTYVALTSGASASGLATVGTIRLAIALSIGVLVGSSVDLHRQLVRSAIGRAIGTFSPASARGTPSTRPGQTGVAPVRGRSAQ